MSCCILLSSFFFFFLLQSVVLMLRNMLPLPKKDRCFCLSQIAFVPPSCHQHAKRESFSGLMSLLHFAVGVFALCHQLERSVGKASSCQVLNNGG